MKWQSVGTAMRYVRQEQRRNERLVNYGHIAIGVSIGLLAALTGGETSRPAFQGMLFAGPFLVSLGVMALLMLRSNNRLDWLPYVSVVSEVAIVTGILVAVGTHASFKGAAFLGYFLIIGLAGLRFSTSLVVTGGILSIISYTLVFIWALATGRTVIAPMFTALMGPYVSVALFVQQCTFLGMLTGLLAMIAARSRRGLAEALAAEFGEERARRSTDRAREGLVRVIATEIAAQTSAQTLSSSNNGELVAALVCDIANVDTLAATRSREELVGVLSRTFTDVSEAIVTFGGTVHAITDRGVVALFGGSRSRDADEEMAVRAADRVLESSDALNREREADGLAPIQIGVGVHTGPASVLSQTEVALSAETVETARRVADRSASTGGRLMVTNDAFARVRGTMRSSARHDVDMVESPVHEIDRAALR